MKAVVPPQRLLLRAPNWLGDAVMALPAVRALKQAHPKAELTVATPAKLAALWNACPWIDRVLELPAPRRYRETVPVLRGERFEMAVLFPNSFRSALEARLAGIGKLVALAEPLRRPLVSHPVPRRPFDAARLHQQYDYLHLVAALGAKEDKADGPLLRQPPMPDGKPAAIVIAPGAAYGPAKQWPAARFATVGRALVKRGLGPLAVMGTGGDAAAASEVALSIPDARDLAGRTDLAQFLAAIAHAKLVITNDSGAMHLAAAFGVPGVAVFGSTEPRLTGPIDPCVRTVRHHVPCSPCFLRQCPLDFACMEGVSPEAVLAACDEALGAAAK